MSYGFSNRQLFWKKKKKRKKIRFSLHRRDIRSKFNALFIVLHIDDIILGRTINTGKWFLSVCSSYLRFPISSICMPHICHLFMAIVLHTLNGYSTVSFSEEVTNFTLLFNGWQQWPSIRHIAEQEEDHSAWRKGRKLVFVSQLLVSYRLERRARLIAFYFEFHAEISNWNRKFFATLTVYFHFLVYSFIWLHLLELSASSNLSTKLTCFLFFAHFSLDEFLETERTQLKIDRNPK